jgi:hypothetical protein
MTELEMTELRELCRALEGRIAERRVIPFLGAGASLADRVRGDDWRREGVLPSGRELAAHLAERRAYPHDEREQLSLLRVAQYIDLQLGEQTLYEDLRETFMRPAKPTVVHRYLAETAASWRAADRPTPWPLIITTNYDDALEQAFADVEEPCDVVTYHAVRDRPGGFHRRLPDGRLRAIGSRTSDFDPDERTVLLKLHGGIDRRDEQGDSFVITEDHYLSFMANDAMRGLPARLLRVLLPCHLLFLGYRIEDWNLRVFLFRIWRDRARSARSWAIRADADELDRRFWERHDVDVVEQDLVDWVAAMRACTR